MVQAHIPFRSLVAELRQLCQERRTGFLFITTDKHRLVQINLDNGEIVFVSFQGQDGENVLPLMRQIHAGQAQFQEKAVSAFRGSLPPTEAILSYLGGGNDGAETVGSETSAKLANEGLPQETKVMLERVLTEFIGPMAVIVCAEHLEKSQDLESAMEILASEIPNPEHASQFKDAVRAKL